MNHQLILHEYEEMIFKKWFSAHLLGLIQFYVYNRINIYTFSNIDSD